MESKTDVLTDGPNSSRVNIGFDPPKIYTKGFFAGTVAL